LSEETDKINSDADPWLKNFSSGSDFSRDAAALLQPGNSIILATIDDGQSALGCFVDIATLYFIPQSR